MTLPYHKRKDIPEAVRRAVKIRAQGFCEDCGVKRRLELHHLTYKRGSGKYEMDIFGMERPQDLAALCRECHKQRHILHGVFYADIDEREANDS